MATVTFVEHDGTAHEMELVEGESLMQIATGNAVPGIDGDCGGEAACGTCHVIVDGAWIARTGARTDQEVLNRPGFRGGSVTWNQPLPGRVFEGSSRF